MMKRTRLWYVIFTTDYRKRITPEPGTGWNERRLEAELHIVRGRTNIHKAALLKGSL